MKIVTTATDNKTLVTVPQLLYVAHRYIGRYEKQSLGPFSSFDAALSCATDSLFPELAKVEEIDLADLSHDYTPVSNASSTAQGGDETYYCFVEDPDEFEGIPANLQQELDYTLVELEDCANDCFDEPESTVTESSIVQGLVRKMDRNYEQMYEIKPHTPAASTALLLTVQFDVVVRARGLEDRRRLLDMFNEGDYIRTWAHDPNKYLDERAQCLADDFWKHFVVDGSSTPVSDLDQWDTA
jgi:hypothetical protein